MSSRLSPLSIDFQARERMGRVQVHYEVNKDPARWGYPLLGLDATLVHASAEFPVVQATVEYDAEGYAAMLGWIQIVRMHNLDTEEDTTLVDRAPQLAELEFPYMAFGARPVLFDAPSLTGIGNLVWDAHAILVMSPDCLMTRTVLPLCGFSWGYRLRESRPIPTPAQRLDVSTWDTDVDVLRTSHPSWTFGNGESWTQDAMP